MSIFSDFIRHGEGIRDLPYPIYNDYEDYNRSFERRLYDTMEVIADAKIRDYMRHNFVFVDVSKN